MTDHVQRTTLLMLGPRRSGATSLLKTLRDGFARSAHAYPDSWRLGVVEADAASRLPASADLFSDMDSATEKSIRPTSYVVDLCLSVPASGWLLGRRSQPLQVQERRAQLEIIDCPGIALEQLADPGAERPREIVEWADKLQADSTRATAVLVVWPINRVETQEDRWLDALRRHIAWLIGPQVRYIIVAFTFWDHALAAAIDTPIEQALAPGILRMTMAKALASNPLMVDTLRLIAVRRRVACLPVSTIGLIKGYFESNWHPGFDDVILKPDGSGVLGDALTGVAGAKELKAEFGRSWLPLCTIDPFLLAAFGSHHGLFVDFDELTGLLGGAMAASHRAA